ncbi:hypothetical protein [Streptomyces pluripotens]|uniref:hypothetical protein n=1 Tax=Streptomyces pluripotens TaxID=1355015 RepID=UPI00069354D7|nr:hypothetical protein [Streptomyces pluripotens]
MALWLENHVLWLSSALTAMCLVIAGAKMAYELRGTGEQMRNVLHGMVKLVLVNTMFIPTVAIATEIGDSYTNWIINESLGGDAAAKLGMAAAAIGESSSIFGGPAIPLILLIFAAIFSLLQMILMYFRAAVLVLLAGTVSLPAATAFTGMGNRWLGRYLSWTLAFILLKPAAATVYAAAYRLMGDGVDKDLGSTITGFVLLSGTILVLPALMKLLQPAGVALAGGTAGGGGGGGYDSGSNSSSSSGPSGSTTASPGSGASSTVDSSPSGASNVGLSSSGSSGISGGGSLGSSAASSGGTGASSGAAAGGSAGAGAGAAGAGAGAGTAVGGGAAAGSAAGPVGTAAGAAVGVAAAGAKIAKDQVQGGLQDAAQGFHQEAEGGPSGA